MNQKFKEIIERIEWVRHDLEMNKSKFSKKIGMKPQTYNNFIGSQGSKPNVELIKGIVDAYRVCPIWLLTGEGLAFRDGKPPQNSGNGNFPPLPRPLLPDNPADCARIIDMAKRASRLALELALFQEERMEKLIAARAVPAQEKSQESKLAS